MGSVWVFRLIFFLRDKNYWFFFWVSTRFNWPRCRFALKPATGYIFQEFYDFFGGTVKRFLFNSFVVFYFLFELVNFVVFCYVEFFRVLIFCDFYMDKHLYRDFFVFFFKEFVCCLLLLGVGFCLGLRENRNWFIYFWAQLKTEAPGPKAIYEKRK